MDFTTNYCGPYWSEGKFQPSVVGELRGVSHLDEACRRHDAAYKNSNNDYEKIVADNKFYEETRGLGIRGPLYGALVLYGNKFIRAMGGNSSNLRGFNPVLLSGVGKVAVHRPLGAATDEPGRNRPVASVFPSGGESVCEPTINTNTRMNEEPEETYLSSRNKIVPLYRPLRKKKLKQVKLLFNQPPKTKQKPKIIQQKSNKVRPHGPPKQEKHYDQAS